MTSQAHSSVLGSLRDRLAAAHSAQPPDASPPIVDSSHLTPDARKRLERFRGARDRLLAGFTVDAASRHAGVSERRFFRIMERYLSVADDGRLGGERCFVRNWRPQARPMRTKPEVVSDSRSAWGATTGLFQMLMRDNQDLRAAVVDMLRRKGKASLTVNKLVGRELRKAFVNLCQRNGVREDQYPLNTQDRGLKALRRWIQSDFLPRYASDWISATHGPGAARTITTPQSADKYQSEYLPYHDWQLDQVTVDLRCSLEIINESGMVDVVEVERVRMLRLIELGHNCNLAFHIVLSRQATAEDVGNLLWKALNGWEQPKVLDDLEMLPGAGYPAMALQELRWRAPRVVHLDNALAHLSATLGVIVEHRLGASLRLGTAAKPLERPEIESKFALMARRLIHQLPGSVGSGPHDVVRRNNQSLSASQLIKVEQLEHACFVMFANENGCSSSAAHGIPALERLRRAMLRGSILAPKVSLSNQIRHMFFAPKKVLVHADLKWGRKPFVNISRIRYSSEALQKRFDLVRQSVYAYTDPDDLRVALLLDEGGKEICRVAAEGRWGILPHDHRMRRMAMSSMNKAAFSEMPQDGPLLALFARLERDAPTQPSAALQLAHCLAVLGKHVTGAATSDVYWLSHLLAEGHSLEVAARSTTAANADSAEETVASSLPCPESASAPTESKREPKRLIPRNAVRRL